MANPGAANTEDKKDKRKAILAALMLLGIGAFFFGRMGKDLPAPSPATPASVVTSELGNSGLPSVGGSPEANTRVAASGVNPPGQDIKDAVSDLKDAPSSPPGQTIASNPGIDDPGHQGGGGDTPNPGQDLPNPGDEGGSTVSQSGPPQTFFPDSH